MNTAHPADETSRTPAAFGDSLNFLVLSSWFLTLIRCRANHPWLLSMPPEVPARSHEELQLSLLLLLHYCRECEL